MECPVCNQFLNIGDECYLWECGRRPMMLGLDIHLVPAAIMAAYNQGETVVQLPLGQIEFDSLELMKRNL